MQVHQRRCILVQATTYRSSGSRNPTSTPQIWGALSQLYEMESITSKDTHASRRTCLGLISHAFSIEAAKDVFFETQYLLGQLTHM